MLGGVVSTTVTFWVAWAEFPESSVAVQVTVVTPSGNRAGASLVTVASASQMSLTVGVPRSAAVPSALACSTSMFAGAVIVGGVVSTTVTFWVAWAEFPESSVAVQVSLGRVPRIVGRGPGDCCHSERE